MLGDLKKFSVGVKGRWSHFWTWQCCKAVMRAHDPGWVNTGKFLLFGHSYLLPVLSSRVGWLDNF
jgi:hypothetical protein